MLSDMMYYCNGTSYMFNSEQARTRYIIISEQNVNNNLLFGVKYVPLFQNERFSKKKVSYMSMPLPQCYREKWDIIFWLFLIRKAKESNNTYVSCGIWTIGECMTIRRGNKGNDGRERIVEGCCIHMGTLGKWDGKARGTLWGAIGAVWRSIELHGWDGEGTRA